MTDDQALYRRIRSIEPNDAENRMTGLTRELDELRATILKKNRSRPDPKILVKGKSAIEQFTLLAIAAHRMRSRWPNAGAALDTLEAWRKDWNLVASAALVHAKDDLVEAEPGSEAHDRALKTITDLVDLIGATFRPLTGPQGKWLAVQADAVDKVLN